jgi:nitrogen fixation/metabolism regulation signal transduction histidine kinase
VEVQHRYANRHEIQSVTKNDIEDFLIKLSNVFFTDINFYGTSGALIASSRQQIFDEGLVSSEMNPDAFKKLVIEKGSIYIHNESIGTMHFSSAYLPLFNEQNNLLGYINLPYFSRQDELKREISSFLVTFINIYILLILFGVFITVLISNYITAPLSMLAQKLSKLRLDKVNEKIDWHYGDEIGQLVLEYNRMIDELSRSAEKLAQSERESAWREMARQVAHEIKNPLTPMKLSAQYLQKAWNDNAPDMGERLMRFTKMLIEQIDTLSAIASDFSNFAKMPVVSMERVDVAEIIRFVFSMYKDTSEIKYGFTSGVADTNVLADRALMIRIFTNLLNNAVQAIGASEGGAISIHLNKEDQYMIITVADNGSGISTERSEKIFQPDFTTKTGGMGLGLAIVKGLVVSMKGEISFTSHEHQGTTFTIKLPSNVEPIHNEQG